MIGTHAVTDPVLINAYHTSLDVHHKTPSPMHVHALNRGLCVIITFSGGEGFEAIGSHWSKAIIPAADVFTH